MQDHPGREEVTDQRRERIQNNSGEQTLLSIFHRICRTTRNTGEHCGQGQRQGQGENVLAGKRITRTRKTDIKECNQLLLKDVNSSRHENAS